MSGKERIIRSIFWAIIWSSIAGIVTIHFLKMNIILELIGLMIILAITIAYRAHTLEYVYGYPFIYLEKDGPWFHQLVAWFFSRHSISSFQEFTQEVPKKPFPEEELLVLQESRPGELIITEGTIFIRLEGETDIQFLSRLQERIDDPTLPPEKRSDLEEIRKAILEDGQK